MWVNGTVTNVGRNKLCGFSFTSMDSDLSVATKVPPDLPVLNTTEIAVGEVRAGAGRSSSGRPHM